MSIIIIDFSLMVDNFKFVVFDNILHIFQISDVSKLSLSEKRELVYGPGGIFGSSGPFSTPGVSRYPEPTKPRSKHDQGYTGKLQYSGSI